MFLQKLKSSIKANPTVYRVVMSVYKKWHPPEAERLRRFLQRLTRKVQHPIFVKVGANDGITDDPCGDVFLRNQNWHGLLIEPVPYCVEELESVYVDRRRFIIDQVAVGRIPGTAKFYYVSREAENLLSDLPGWYDQLGSFNRQHIVKHLDGILEPFIVAGEVNVEPLGEIVRRHGFPRIDFLHIDTEGYDLEVLRTLDFGEYSPLGIFVEHRHLSPDERKEMKALLETNEYDVRDAGADYFAVHYKAGKYSK